MARGLGSPNMDPAKKRQIQSMGGKASHGGGRKRSQPVEVIEVEEVVVEE